MGNISEETVRVAVPRTRCPMQTSISGGFHPTERTTRVCSLGALPPTFGGVLYGLCANQKVKNGHGPSRARVDAFSLFLRPKWAQIGVTGTTLGQSGPQHTRNATQRSLDWFCSQESPFPVSGVLHSVC
uniref:Uncharacterized protein n=1 Tax=Eutreptiella gymnastica TaxID=73025 RepID=A0A7S1J1C8_9EUGL|mmetsp:Transcript_58443/g.104277  ORF Transcript_58443/g.104277 Transcript_58443/m.104277 type:complete len:129 (+) Transcript_58443:619-1005(+)